MNAIDINHVFKNYDQFEALKGVSLNIQQGEFFGLLGPNGAGKSTLINIMSGLTRASKGDVYVHEHHVVKQYRDARRNIGIVPQEIAFDPFFTVREALKLQSGYMGIRPALNKKWIDELLHTLHLDDKADTRVKFLSGGMKRRVLIAQALIHKPPVLVLDEPTAGVDVELRKILWDFVNKLNKEGHTIILTTHYLDEAESLCDRIGILNQGQLKALDTKSELINRHPYRFLRIWPQTPAQCPHSLQHLIHEKDHQSWLLKLDKREDKMGDVMAELHRNGVVMEDFETLNPGLEEVFVEMTKTE